LVDQVVKVNGYVNSAAGFTDQPAVIDGASDLMRAVFGERGRHARTSVGVAELPGDIPVEIEMIVELSPAIDQGERSEGSPDGEGRRL
jgi:enamine deaminase RidA (YjgF/YER057c/UK114 family)